MKRYRDRPLPTPEQERQIRADQCLISRLKQEFGVKSDLALAKRLGIPPTTLGRVIRGEGTLSWEHRWVIRDKLGFAAVRNTLTSLLPKKLSESLINASHRQFLRGIECNEDELLSPAERALNTLETKAFDGFSEVITELSRLRPLAEIRENGEFTVKERSLIIETLNRVDAKVWQCLIEDLSECVCSTNYLHDVISLTVGDISDSVNKTNQLLDAVSNKFDFKTSGRVADELGIKAGTLSNVRKGRGSLPPKAAFKLNCLLENDTLEAANREFAASDEVLSDSDKFIAHISPG